MGSIKNIVNVQITRDTTVPSRAGFGTGAFVSASASFAEAAKNYADYEEMTDDATVGADSLVFGATYFGQALSPTKLTIIKEGTGNVQVSTLVQDADFVELNSAVIVIDGAAVAGSPVVWSDTHVNMMTAVAAALQAEAGVTTAVSDGVDTIEITWADNNPHTALVVVSLGASQPTVVHAITTASATDITAGLNDAVAYDNDWYGIAQYSRVDADILGTAAWVQANTNSNPKLFFAQSDDPVILTAVASDVASILTGLSYFRTSVWYHALDAEYMEAAALGGQLPQLPGSITWAYKNLAGITPDTALTAGQKAYAHAKNCNTYDTVASVSITEEGKVSDTGLGEWIDVMRGVDWITANMTADLFTMLVGSPKIPYTSDGLATVRGTMEISLSAAQSMGILTTDDAYTISIPKITAISAADKGTRTLNDVTFGGVLAGAIQKINVRGTVSL